MSVNPIQDLIEAARGAVPLTGRVTDQVADAVLAARAVEALGPWEREWQVVDECGREQVRTPATQSTPREHAERWDRICPEDAPHTVRPRWVSVWRDEDVTT